RSDRMPRAEPLDVQSARRTPLRRQGTGPLAQLLRVGDARSRRRCGVPRPLGGTVSIGRRRQARHAQAATGTRDRGIRHPDAGCRGRTVATEQRATASARDAKVAGRTRPDVARRDSLHVATGVPARNQRRNRGSAAVGGAVTGTVGAVTGTVGAVTGTVGAVTGTVSSGLSGTLARDSLTGAVGGADSHKHSLTPRAERTAWTE